MRKSLPLTSESLSLISLSLNALLICQKKSNNRKSGNAMPTRPLTGNPTTRPLPTSFVSTQNSRTGPGKIYGKKPTFDLSVKEKRQFVMYRATVNISFSDVKIKKNSPTSITSFNDKPRVTNSVCSAPLNERKDQTRVVNIVKKITLKGGG